MNTNDFTNEELARDVRIWGAKLSYSVEELMLQHSKPCFRVPCEECALYIKGECLEILLQCRRNELFKNAILAARPRENTQIVK